MAKKTKEGPSKSDSIRAYLADNPKAGPTAVFQALKEQGIHVSVALVSAIKAKGKRRGRKPGPKTTRGRKTKAGSNGAVSLELLLAAKKLAEQLGGIDKARAALDMLARLS